MFNIIVERECGCFKRSGMASNTSIESKDEALSKSIEMRDKMNDDFCGKHGFKVLEVNNSFVIAMNDSTTGGCCGGGCSTH